MPYLLCLFLFVMDFPSLQHPFTAVLAGPSKSGKSFFIKDFIYFKTYMVKPTPDKIVWFYGIYQNLYDEISDVTFIEGFPTNYEEYLGTNTLFIIDDLMCEVGGDRRLTNLFTKGSHHHNLSIFFITQNFFHKGTKDLRLNADYLFLFKNRRDLNQITCLGRQLYPRNHKFFQEVYADATRKPFTYLLIDLKNETDEEHRLRTQILPNQNQYYYTLKYK